MGRLAEHRTGSLISPEPEHHWIELSWAQEMQQAWKIVYFVHSVAALLSARIRSHGLNFLHRSIVRDVFLSCLGGIFRT